MKPQRFQSETKTDRVEQLARDVFVSLYTTPIHGITDQGIATRAIKAATVFYELIDLRNTEGA